MPTYEACDESVTVILKKVLRKWHRELVAAEVSFSLAFARGKDGGPALVHHGYQAAARVRINPPLKRAEGGKDVTLEIDEKLWQEWTEQRREAVLHHECLHLLVKKDKKGKVKLDDNGRPKLKMRLHDVQLGIFYDAARHYGEDSLDFEQVADIARRYEQGEFSFAEQAAAV